MQSRLAADLKRRCSRVAVRHVEIEAASVDSVVFALHTIAEADIRPRTITLKEVPLNDCFTSQFDGVPRDVPAREQTRAVCAKLATSLAHIRFTGVTQLDRVQLCTGFFPATPVRIDSTTSAAFAALRKNAALTSRLAIESVRAETPEGVLTADATCKWLRATRGLSVLLRADAVSWVHMRDECAAAPGSGRDKLGVFERMVAAHADLRLAIYRRIVPTSACRDLQRYWHRTIPESIRAAAGTLSLDIVALIGVPAGTAAFLATELRNLTRLRVTLSAGRTLGAPYPEQAAARARKFRDSVSEITRDPSKLSEFKEFIIHEDYLNQVYDFEFEAAWSPEETHSVAPRRIIASAFAVLEASGTDNDDTRAPAVVPTPSPCSLCRADRSTHQDGFSAPFDSRSRPYNSGGNLDYDDVISI